MENKAIEIADSHRHSVGRRRDNVQMNSRTTSKILMDQSLQYLPFVPSHDSSPSSVIAWFLLPDSRPPSKPWNTKSIRESNENCLPIEYGSQDSNAREKKQKKVNSSYDSKNHWTFASQMESRNATNPSVEQPIWVFACFVFKSAYTERANRLKLSENFTWHQNTANTSTHCWRVLALIEKKKFNEIW